MSNTTMRQTILERPYQQALAEAEAIDRWCEDNDVNPDDPDVRDRALDAMIDDMWEGIIAKHERQQDDLLDDHYYNEGFYP